MLALSSAKTALSSRQLQFTGLVYKSKKFAQIVDWMKKYPANVVDVNVPKSIRPGEYVNIFASFCPLLRPFCGGAGRCAVGAGEEARRARGRGSLIGLCSDHCHQQRNQPDQHLTAEHTATVHTA